MRIIWPAALASLAAAATAFAQPSNRVEEDNPALRAPASAADLGDLPGDTPGIIVKFRSGGTAGRVQAQAADDAVSKLAARGNLTIREARALPAGLHVLKAERLPGESFAQLLARVRADADVEFAEPDRRRYPHALPNDPLYAGQWYLQNRVDTPSAVNAEGAWDSGTGDLGVVIAVIDTGVLFDHPDLKRAHLGGRILPGHDFIANAAAANDGGGRDSDASDAGDWVTQQESNQGQFSGCSVSNSSWHGTRVAGIIAALANNSEGVTGSTWSSWILPVRALGKCGGFDSDILEAMAWAGGIHVNGVPDNPYPAKIENLSLGADGPCSNAYASVVGQLAARGVLVVASAGNEGGPVGSPANCAGVAAVTGLRHAGTKVGFASLGPQVAVGAPGGNCVNTTGGPCLFSIDTTHNTGTQSPGAFSYTNQTNVNVGTSFSAPIVAGIVGLMAGANGNLGSAQLIARLREGATTPFPVSTDPTIPMCHVPVNQQDLQQSECNCTTSTCGAGMADAAGALTAALRPIAALSSPATVIAGQNVNLSGAGSGGACNRTISTYFWEVVSGAGVLTGPNNTPTTSVNAPVTGSFTVRLTVTDDAGRQDSADVVINPTSTSTAAPATAGNNACPTDVPPPAAITVEVTPTSASLVAGSGTQTFAATVSNAQSNTSVTWRVNGVTGGNATIGTISVSGTYAAPANVPSPSTVTVTATSVEDATKSAAAQVTITSPLPIAVAVTPTSASLVAGSGTQTFGATVSNGQSNTSVTWQVDGVMGGNATIGTISVGGTYTAPASVPSPSTVTVTATSIEDTTKSASAQVTITAPPPPASGGGGGAGFDLMLLLGALTAFARVAPRTVRGRHSR
jgi:serine protease